MMRDDWRRANTDAIIKMLSIAIKAEKPWVKFGVSPFGVWRNKDKDPEGSYTKGGQTNYDDLFADILKWLKNGWIDYVAPQIYWERGHRLADYEILLNWWSQHSYGGRYILGMVFIAWAVMPPGKNPNELPAQIEEARTLNTIQGSIFYSAASFRGNPLGIEDALRTRFVQIPGAASLLCRGCQRKHLRRLILLMLSNGPAGWKYTGRMMIPVDIPSSMCFTVLIKTKRLTSATYENHQHPAAIV